MTYVYTHGTHEEAVEVAARRARRTGKRQRVKVVLNWGDGKAHYLVKDVTT